MDTFNAATHPNQKPLRTLWMLFFLLYASIGVSFTFINVYYASIGLTGTQIGLLSTIGALTSMVGAALWGYLSDRTGQARWIMAIGGFLAGGLFFLTPLMRTFTALVILTIGIGIFASSAFTLIDALTLTLLGEHRGQYGRYRLGGSLGYILTASLGGFIYQRLGLTLIFPIYLFIMVLFGIISLRLPVIHLPSSSQQKASLKGMVTQPAWLLFMFCVFLVWTASAGFLNFLGVTIQDMGGASSLIGLAGTIAAITEIPFMYYSGWFLQRLGVTRMLWISMAFYTLRLGLYSIMPSPYWVLGINMMNGPTYVFFWNSAISYAFQLAPAEYKATAQGFFVAVTNLSAMVGALLSGWLYDTSGPAGMFRVLGLFCLAAFTLFAFNRSPRTATV